MARRQCFEVKCVDAAPFQGRCNGDQVCTCTWGHTIAVVALLRVAAAALNRLLHGQSQMNV